MCQNAVASAGAVLKAEEPTLVALLTALGLNTTPNGIAAVNAFDAAVTAVENWKQGTSAQTALQLIGDFQTVFATIPLPSNVSLLANVILAGVSAAIGILTANSPAPVAPAGTVAAPEPQALHQALVAHDTVVKIHELVPGIKLTRFHSAAHQYNEAWNDAAEKSNMPQLKVAA
jgi:hypothetical protein